jgi:hypothetical protein
MLDKFEDFDPSKYEDEVRERWGDTDAYRESARRTAGYTERDWQQIGREIGDISAAFIALMETGTPVDSAEATGLVERHRAHISKWFYECTPEIHGGLGQMYRDDPRFTRDIDKAAPGLAQYMSAAIAANLRR